MNHLPQTPEEECIFVRLPPDGQPVIRLRGVEQRVEIHGIEIPQPPPALYAEVMTRWILKLRRPIRCVVRSTGQAGQVRVKLLYYGWQDKSGDVWLDLALALLDEGLVRVAPSEFPEREDYLQHERAAQAQGKGIWSGKGT